MKPFVTKATVYQATCALTGNCDRGSTTACCQFASRARNQKQSMIASCASNECVHPTQTLADGAARDEH